MIPQLKNQNNLKQSISFNTNEENGGTKMFKNQMPNQLSFKDFNCVLHLVLVILMMTLAAVSCSDNPVAPSSPDNNPGPEEQTLSVSINASTTNGAPGLSTSFTSVVTGGTPPYTYNWQFSDGTNSTIQNPTHIFNREGTYNVSLIVHDISSATDTALITITVASGSAGLTCEISADNTNGPAPLAVNFVGNASGGLTPYTYHWNFGDGSTSTSANPNHTYQSTGTYTARLTVTDSNSGTTTKTIAISVTSAQSLDCTASANITEGRAPVSVSFSGTATNGSAPYAFYWQFGDGNSSSQQNPSHTYQSVGTYTARLTVTDASSATCSKTVTISALNAPPGPILSGPGTVTGDFQLTWTFNWPALVATGEGVSIEQSTTSSSSGFTQISTVTRSQGSAFGIMDKSPGTYYYRVRAYVNQGTNRGWTQYSNVVRVDVQAVTSRTRFVNNTSYIIISLTVDGIQYFTNSTMGIMPGSWFEIDLAPGSHIYTVTNGFWDGSSRFNMYTWNGSIYQSTGELETLTFNDPSVNQLLTQFESSGLWSGDFWDNLTPHKAAFRFYSNGTWRLYVDGVSQSTGTYSLVSRNPSSFSIVFSIGNYTATLYETQGRFVMRNGPPDWPLIEYYHIGQ